MNAVIAHMPVGVMVAESPEGRLLLGNKKIEELWREPVLDSNGEPLPHRCRSFHLDGQEYVPGTCPMSRALFQGETVTDERMLLKRWDGSETMATVSSTPLLDEDEEMIAAVATFCEIHDTDKTSFDPVAPETNRA